MSNGDRTYPRNQANDRREGLRKAPRKVTPPGGRKAPRKATPKSLENAALYHLQRFSSSAANLRRVLLRRVERSARAHGSDRDEGTAAVDEIVARFVRSGLLDDRAYAEAKAGTLHRRGASARKIQATLMQKGVGQDDIETALASLTEETAEPELAAAIHLARRRRLGPYRAEEIREERRQKDLAALARAGFGYDIARRVIEATDVAALEAEVLR